jgi:hypothetical protein
VSSPLLDLDRRTARSWIALVTLAVFVAVVAACSSPADESSSSQSALAESGRWTLPSNVLAVGATVRVTYDEAPKWTGSAACAGKLKPGGHKLGEYLIEHFAVVSSVGGYACRRNTADASRMSVHGSGRALDVFIPTAGGAADNTQGDKVANWLVLHAQRIGVQLVIWDRTIWRSSGRNDGAYGGPNPHVDHIHVELTNEAAAMSTPWFSDMDDDAPDGSTASADGGDVGDVDADEDTADGGQANDAGADSATRVDASTGPKDAGKKDAAPVDPSDDDAEHDEPDAATTSPGTNPNGSKEPPKGSGDPSDGLESAADDPGETDSLPDVPKPKRRTPASSANGETTPNGGCSAAPGNAGSHGMDGSALALAVGLALAGAARARKRTRGGRERD